MSSGEQGEVPKGSVAAGNRVKLPRGAEPPFTVFINGVPQSEGADYRVAAGDIVFARQIVKEERVGFGRWLAMLIGLFGTYRKHETVDVQFTRAGKLELASDLPIHAAQATTPADRHGGRSH
jgi:hypothetical protein